MHEPPAAAENAIEIRIDDISQLFHTLDPFPFRERDLDKDAEEFIVSWARELRADQPFRIVVHLPEAQASIPEAHEIAAAITGYFGHRVRTIMLDLKELFRVGWRALAIGLIVLFLSVIIGQTVVANLAPRPIGRVIEESLLLFGWVANWRPIEIFLYEWWPIVRRRNLYQRLAAAQVDLKPYKSDKKRRSLASEC
jgi:CBS domain containing-hemolysin-like protein